jgi:hypothetical protein
VLSALTYWLARITTLAWRPMVGRRWLPMWAMLHYRGRRSGRLRSTPVQIRTMGDEYFVVAVPWPERSQWIRNVMSATDVYRYSGLLTYAYEHFEGLDDRALHLRTFERPFPLRKIISPLYISYESFHRLPKPPSYRAFFVVRDPRDLVVSHYFSSKYSHLENPGVIEERNRLQGLSETDGMAVHMRYMAERGIFDALRSWAQQTDGSDEIRIFRFEDLVGGDQLNWMMQLMGHCDIAIPQHRLEAILKRLSFARLSGGRNQGEENKYHKYRSGTAGDWKKYFTEALYAQFNELAGD